MHFSGNLNQSESGLLPLCVPVPFLILVQMPDSFAELVWGIKLAENKPCQK